MSIETSISLIILNTISGIITNLPYLILFVWGINVIAKELREGIKNIPNWINQYDDIRTKHYHIQKALENRR
jgi:predicted PurR-regulated permease PerM